MRKGKIRLGELMMRDGLIIKEQLNEALQVQKETEERLGECLIKLGYISEKDLALNLSKQLDISYISLSQIDVKKTIEQRLHNLIPAKFAKKHLLLPIYKHFNSITVAFVDPLDLLTLDNLKKMTGCEINSLITTKSEILRGLDNLYGKDSLLRDAIKESYKHEKKKESSIETVLEEEEKKEEDKLSLDKLIAKAEEAPVVKLVDLILKQAIDEGASDIHIEPVRDKLSLRYRIDGVLREITSPASHLHTAIVSRVKILSKLDIAEKRLPQDGSFIVKIEDRMIDLRVSTIPTVYGEKVVLRILDKSRIHLDLKYLGFEKDEYEIFREVIKAPYGLMLLTGPTGCGKTTTLYAALNEVKSPDKNIITIEEPVEYRLDGINQVQAKPQIGLTFANGLRSFLRQDPDIIFVGEVRDLETAEICVRASLTGHLVFSTVHTNDASGAITRLLDIGIESFLLGSILNLVIAQRLIRKLCPECKQGYEPPLDIFKGIKIKSDLIYRAKGCEYCNMTGYKGRCGIFEILQINESIRKFICQKVPIDVIREEAQKQGMRTLWESGVIKVEKGITSVEEVGRVTLTI